MLIFNYLSIKVIHMKKYINKSFAYIITLMLLCIIGCTDLDVPVVSELTPTTFPKTQEDFVALASSAYSYFGNTNDMSRWITQELSTDFMICTANGGSWYDAGRWQQFYWHTYNKDNGVIEKYWQYGFNAISACNRVLELMNTAPEGQEKNTAIAEIRSLRALCLFWMMDSYGDIPLATKFGSTPEGRKPRADVYNFIESELTDALNDLKSVVNQSTYGRPTKWMAYALLAKLYLNAPIYIGQTKYNEAINACDQIINEAKQYGTFALDANYAKMFDIDNGPQIKDFIFAIPYDCNNILTSYEARWWLHPLLQNKYSLPYAPSGSVKLIPEFYDKFSDPNDIRKNVFLTGLQYNLDGSPIMITTTNKGYDSRYSGPDPNAVITVQLELTREIEFRDYAKFDTGNDLKGRSVGYRCNKFYPDKNSKTRDQSNDVPVFRYADILLMKAEAILRGGTATLGDTPVSLANMVRARAKASSYTDINLDELLNERARELFTEGWRRNDLIRFGKFEDPWPFKTDNNPQKRIFPIPQSQININPSLTQNPGY